MKFIVDYAAIKSALQLGIGATEKKTVLPVTTHARLETLDEDTLQVAMTDIDMTVIVNVPARVASRGGCTVEAAALLDIAKNTDDALSCELASNMRLKVATGTASYELPAMPLDYFPPLPVLDDGEDLALSFGDFLPMLRSVDYAIASDDDQRFRLRGVYLNITKRQVDACAMDGYRCALARLDGKFGRDCALMLPSKLVRATSKFTLRTGGEFSVAIRWNENHIGAIHDAVQLIGRREDVSFPNYKDAIPESWPETSFRVDTKRMTAALSRAVAFAGTDYKGVRLTITSGSVRIEPRTPGDRGTSSDAVPIDNYGSATGEIAISGSRMIDALQNISTESADIDFGDPADENPSTMLLIRPYESERSFSVVHMIARMKL